METSAVRQKVNDTIERAKRTAAARRARNEEASRAYAPFLDKVAIPLFRQVASVLKASGYAFTVFTPGGAVRLMSDRAAEDFIELSLDTSGDAPVLMGHVSRMRGRRLIETEHPISNHAVEETTDEDLLAFLLREIEPFVSR
jgi:hypothetical protein